MSREPKRLRNKTGLIINTEMHWTARSSASVHQGGPPANVCIYSYARMSLTLTPWPWHSTLTYMFCVKMYLHTTNGVFGSRLSNVRARTGHTHTQTDRQTDKQLRPNALPAALKQCCHLANARRETSFSCHDMDKKQNTKHGNVAFKNNIFYSLTYLLTLLQLDAHGSRTERVLNAVSSATAIIVKSSAPITASNTKLTSIVLNSSVELTAAWTPDWSEGHQQSTITVQSNAVVTCETK